LVIKTLDSELDPDPQLGKCWIRIRIRNKPMQMIHNPGSYVAFHYKALFLSLYGFLLLLILGSIAAWLLCSFLALLTVIYGIECELRNIKDIYFLYTAYWAHKSTLDQAHS
jgi:hypothetical protein